MNQSLLFWCTSIFGKAIRNFGTTATALRCCSSVESKGPTSTIDWSYGTSPLGSGPMPYRTAVVCYTAVTEPAKLESLDSKCEGEPGVVGVLLDRRDVPVGLKHLILTLHPPEQEADILFDDMYRPASLQCNNYPIESLENQKAVESSGELLNNSLLHVGSDNT